MWAEHIFKRAKYIDKSGTGKYYGKIYFIKFWGLSFCQFGAIALVADLMRVEFLQQKHVD